MQDAYRTLAKKYHPDLNKLDPECARIMKIINESYVALSDPEKRRQHDS
ncbi:DnaJ domain-containing protein [Klebsiella variicola]